MQDSSGSVTYLLFIQFLKIVLHMFKYTTMNCIYILYRICAHGYSEGVNKIKLRNY